MWDDFNLRAGGDKQRPFQGTEMLFEKLRTTIANWRFSRRRFINLAIGISALLLYEAARAYYRPFIYSQAINDFHIADTLGNSLGTVTTVFVFVALLGRGGQHDYFLLRTVTIGVLVYELAHPLLGKPVDVYDLVATVLAGVLCEGLYRLLHGRPPLAVNKP